MRRKQPPTETVSICPAIASSATLRHSARPVFIFCCTSYVAASAEQRIATELNARPAQVAAAIALLDEGATVPFARYRKEATDNLDDA